jgi:hypothetical protein
VAFWADHARAAGVKNDAGLRDWMRDEYGVTGYSQYAVSWELFGYPDALLAWASASASMHPPRAGWKP